MNIFELRKMLRQPEGPKLDFKQKFYAIESSAKDRHWGECIKDIISLANGNIGYANQPGYLIIGPEDKLPASGNRTIHSVQPTNINIVQVRDKVNSACHPAIPNIILEETIVDGQNILVFTIHPSPHLYELIKDITTESRTYYKGTVFIRVGESIHNASPGEILALIHEKEISFNISRQLSYLQRRIDNAQENINSKRIEYDNIRNKLDTVLGDYTKLESLQQIIEVESILVIFLKEKEKIERTILLNGDKLHSNINNKYFNYGIKMIKELIPRLPLDYPYSPQILKEMISDAKEKLDLAIQYGCDKPSAYYELMKMYDNKTELTDAYNVGEGSMNITHRHVELSQLHIEICHIVIGVYPDYEEDALERIEFEKNRLMTILRVEVDNWGKPIHATL